MAAGKKGKTEGKSQAKAEGAKPAKGGKGKGKQDAAPNTKEPAKKKGAQSILVRHILCDKHSKKEEALQKLKAGELTWAKACEEYAIEKARTGGLIGWKKKGDLQPEFEAVAFGMDAFKDHKGSAADYNYGDCKTVFGYHIIQVDEKK